MIRTDITRKKGSRATHKSGIEKLFQTIQEIRTTFEDSKLAELIENKQAILDKIKIVKALEARDTRFMKLKVKLKRQLTLNYFVMENYSK